MQKVKRQFCSISKRIVTGFLAFLLSVLIIVGSAYRNPVKVEAAATAGGIAIGLLVAAAATAMGIGVNAGVNNESYQQSCEQIGAQVQKKIAADGKALSTLVEVGANNTITMSKEFLFDVAQAGAKFFPPVDMDFSQTGYSAFSSWLASASGLTIGSSNVAYGWQASFKGSDGPLKYCKKWKVTGKTTFTQPVGKDYKEIQIGAFAGTPLFAYQVAAATGNAFSVLIPGVSSFEILWGFSASESSCGIAELIASPSNHFINLEAFDCQKQQVVDFLLETGEDAWQGICAYPKTAQPLPYTGEDVFDPADKAFFAEGYSAMIHSFADVVARIGAIQGVIDGIRVKIGSLSIPGIRTLTQTQILEKDITTEKDTDADDTRNKGRSTTVPKNPDIPNVSIPQMVFRKFPFCLPIDFLRGVKMMQAPPKPPVFDLPLFVVPQLHWNYHVTLDLKKFDKNDTLVGIVRWAVGVLWSFGLIFVTKKLIWK